MFHSYVFESSSPRDVAIKLHAFCTRFYLRHVFLREFTALYFTLFFLVSNINEVLTKIHSRSIRQFRVSYLEIELTGNSFLVRFIVNCFNLDD